MAFPATKEEFAALVAREQARPDFRRPISFWLELVKPMKWQREYYALSHSSRYVLNLPGENLGTATVLMKAMKLKKVHEMTWFIDRVLTTHELRKALRYLRPHDDGGMHRNLDLIKTARNLRLEVRVLIFFPSS